MKKVFKLIILAIIFLCPSIVFASDLTIMPIGTDNWGDSALLESNGKYLLMDVTQGAPADSEAYSNVNSDDVLNFLIKKGVKTFDLYLSHYHDDHYGGYNKLTTDGSAQSLMKWMVLNSGKTSSYKNYSFTIGTLYLPDPSVCFAEPNMKCEELYVSLKNIAESNNINFVTLSDENKTKTWTSDTGNNYSSAVKDNFTIGTTSAKVLHINKLNKATINHSLVSDIASLSNNSSLVTMFTTTGGIKFLSAGDIEKYTETILAKELEFSIKADIFKLSHHGKATSNLEEFLTAVNPKYAYFQHRVNSLSKSSYKFVEQAVNDLNNKMNTNIYTSQVFKLHKEVLKTDGYTPTWGDLTFKIDGSVITPIIEDRTHNLGKRITINYVDVKTNKNIDKRTYDFHTKFYPDIYAKNTLGEYVEIGTNGVPSGYTKVEVPINYYLYDYDQEFNGYELNLEKSDEIQTVGKLTKDITYNLKYYPIYKLTIKHVDSEGKVLKTEEQEVLYDDKYTTSPDAELSKTYDVVLPDNQNGTIEDDTTVIYTYTLKSSDEGENDNPITTAGGIVGMSLGLMTCIGLIFIAKKRLKKIS